MTGIYAVTGIALVLFIIGYATGYTSGKDDARRLRGVAPVFVGGSAAVIIWGAAIEGVRAPAAGVMTMLFIAAFVALLIFGLGRLLGSAVSLWCAEGPRRRTAVILTVGLPAAFAGWMVHGLSQAEAALQDQQAAAREALQSVTHSARFSTYDITLPGAPALEVLHPCSNRMKKCRTMFWYSPGWNKRPDGALELFSFGVVTHPSVLEAQARWCARPDVSSEGIWCTLTDNDSMRFKPADELHGMEAARETRCGLYHTGEVGCELSHDVVPGVVALVSSLAVDEGTARAVVLAKRARADALWASVTGNARP